MGLRPLFRLNEQRGQAPLRDLFFGTKGGFAQKVSIALLSVHLCVLCVSVVDEFRVKTHHSVTEDTEVAQRNPAQGLFVQSRGAVRAALVRLVEKYLFATKESFGY